jgi:DNA polymerase III subunit epsilon
MNPLTYVDLETTGLDANQHEILEIAILKPTECMPQGMYCDQPVRGWSSFVSKVCPVRIETAHPKALEVNRYSAEEWKNAPFLSQLLPLFRPLLEDALIVGHNVWLDCEFLSAVFRQCGMEPPCWKYRVDTATLIWEHLGSLGHPSLSLESACEIVGIDNTGSHRALADVLRTKALVEALTNASLEDRLKWKKRITELQQRQAEIS